MAFLAKPSAQHSVSESITIFGAPRSLRSPPKRGLWRAASIFRLKQTYEHHYLRDRSSSSLPSTGGSHKFRAETLTRRMKYP